MISEKSSKGTEDWRLIPEQAGRSEIPGLKVAEMMTANKLSPLSEQIQTRKYELFLA